MPDALYPTVKKPPQPVVVEQPHPKTTGEKWFGRIRFAIGETVILGLTAGLAYVARFGKDHYGPVPNYLKQFQGWMEDKLLNNSALPLNNGSTYGPRLAKIIAGTTVLMHGGNVFIPIMRMIENSKERIVTAINKRWGKPGEVEAGKVNVHAEPKQNWWDLIKGRVLSWLVVFTSFVTADALSGKNKDGQYRFDKFEDWFGRLVAGLTRSGRAIGTSQTTDGLKANKAYRFGTILSLDIYATAAALLVWTATSEFSAVLRGRKAVRSKPDSADPIIDAARDIALEDEYRPVRKFTPQRSGDYRSRVKEEPAMGYGAHAAI